MAEDKVKKQDFAVSDALHFTPCYHLGDRD
jgi:hypothetical protein